MPVELSSEPPAKSFPLTSPPKPPEPEPPSEWIAHILDLSDRKIWITWPFPDRIELVTDLTPELSISPDQSGKSAKVALGEFDHDLQDYLAHMPMTLGTVSLPDLYPPTAPSKAVFSIYLNDEHSGPKARVEFTRRKAKEQNFHVWRLKLSFNPFKMGQSGMHAVSAALEDTVAPMLDLQKLKQAFHVTRLDIAIDCIGARPIDLIYSIPKAGKRMVFFSDEGLPESAYFFQHKPMPAEPPKSSNYKTVGPHRLTAYERSAMQRQFGRETTYGDCPVTRLEIVRKWKSQNPTLATLNEFKNPLKDYRVGYAAADDYVTSQRWRDFCYRSFVTGPVPPDGLILTDGDIPLQTRYKKFFGTVLKPDDWTGWPKGTSLTGLDEWAKAG